MLPRRKDSDIIGSAKVSRMPRILPQVVSKGVSGTLSSLDMMVERCGIEDDPLCVVVQYSSMGDAHEWVNNERTRKQLREVDVQKIILFLAKS